MEITNNFSRRHFLAAGSSLALASRLTAEVSAEEKNKLPVIPKKVEKVFKNPAIKEPNDLQFVSDGLWIIDQVDPNKLFKVRPEDGKILEQLQTESMHGSGISVGNGALWITSTKGLKPGTPPLTMKIDPTNGKTLATWVTPESGIWGRPGPNATPSGGHGLKFVDGKYWMAVPFSQKIFLMDAETGKVVRSIPAPETRTHGLALDKGFLWCVGSNDRAVYKMDPKDGKLLAKVVIAEADPAPHGLDIDKNGVLWYCDAASGWICKLV